MVRKLISKIWDVCQNQQKTILKVLNWDLNLSFIPKYGFVKVGKKKEKGKIRIKRQKVAKKKWKSKG